MARSIPFARFSELTESATRLFIANGYRLTQMADVAQLLGVAKGTLYGYVESKEALFDACIRHADGHIKPPAATELPLRLASTRATVTYIQQRLAGEAGKMKLSLLLTDVSKKTSVHTELAVIVSDLYERIAVNRRALKLIDRCAHEYPDLASVWFGQGRIAQHTLLETWITTRISQKRLRPITSPAIAARIMLETITFWAMHRHFDPAPQPVDDLVARETIIALLAHGLLPGGKP